MNIKISKINNPILTHSKLNLKALDLFWAYHPSIVEKKGELFMFYTGKSIKRGISHHVLLAKSLDLENWSKLRHEVIRTGKNKSWDSDFLAHVYVFSDGENYKMLYDGSQKGNWLEEIGMAESRDLVHWTKYKKKPIFKVGSEWWEKRHVSRCSIHKESGVYYLYYAGHDGKVERIGLAKGRSLFNLKRIQKQPVLDLGKKGAWDDKSISDPRVFKYNRRYLMFYSGINTDGIERVGLAVSSDLVKWKKYDKNPILDVSKKGWDSLSASRADIFKFKDKLYLFYSGRKNRYFYNIGIAKVEIS